MVSKSSRHTYKIAVLSGDGIGPEVMAEALKVLEAIGNKFNHSFEFRHGLIGGAAFEANDNHFPSATLELCRRSEAVLFGSVGGSVAAQSQPKWKDAERNAILGIRKALKLSVNLRPAVILPSLAHLSPLKNRIIEQGVDILIIRELLGDVYFGEHKTEKGRAWDVMEYTEEQIRPVIEFACQAAGKRRKRVTVADKANVLDTSRLWRKVSAAVARKYPEVTLEYVYIDNAAMQMITRPREFDVIVTSNLFGDILSDLAASLPGSLGLMPSASLGETINLFEPIGGSAPDIAGKGIANPIAQILSAAMMLRFSFGLETEAQAIERAVQQVLESGIRTADIAEKVRPVVGTAAMGDAICSALNNL